MNKVFYVYILASQKNGTLYIGVTSDLKRRIYEHKQKQAESFTKTHDINRLVYYETYPDAETGITREKQLKEWKRSWKLELIKKENSGWNDLYEGLNS